MDLKITNLKRYFPGTSDSDGFTLLIEHLEVRGDQLTVVMGHNGSGKSVLMRLLAGQERPDAGSVTPKASAIKRVLMHQRADESLASDLTVTDNVVIRMRNGAALANFRPRSYCEQRVQRILSRHPELARKASQRAGNLSGGQRQILAFLALTQHPCDLLLLDEFITSVDAGAAIVLVDLLTRFRMENKCATVVVTHDIAWALKMADRIIVLRSGQVAADFLPADEMVTAEALAKAVSL